LQTEDDVTNHAVNMAYRPVLTTSCSYNKQRNTIVLNQYM